MSGLFVNFACGAFCKTKNPEAMKASGLVQETGLELPGTQKQSKIMRYAVEYSTDIYNRKQQKTTQNNPFRGMA